jgi:hypothetical protein
MHAPPPFAPSGADFLPIYLNTPHPKQRPWTAPVDSGVLADHVEEMLRAEREDAAPEPKAEDHEEEVEVQHEYRGRNPVKRRTGSYNFAISQWETLTLLLRNLLAYTLLFRQAA